MTDISRRYFLKLVAAGAAVSIVAVPVMESLAGAVEMDLREAVKTAEGLDLWYIVSYDFSVLAGAMPILTLTCRRNWTKVVIEMYVDDFSLLSAVHEQIPIALDVRRDAALRTTKLLIDGQEVEGLKSICAHDERPYVEEYPLGFLNYSRLKRS